MEEEGDKEPTVKELSDIVRKLEANKAIEPDGITNELMKYGEQKLKIDFLN